MKWDLTWSQLQARQDTVRYNVSDGMSAAEATANNHALSVQRKAFAGAAFLALGIVLELIFNLDISLLT